MRTVEASRRELEVLQAKKKDKTCPICLELVDLESKEDETAGFVHCDTEHGGQRFHVQCFLKVCCDCFMSAECWQYASSAARAFRALPYLPC